MVNISRLKKDPSLSIVLERLIKMRDLNSETNFCIPKVHENKFQFYLYPPTPVPCGNVLKGIPFNFKFRISVMIMKNMGYLLDRGNL